MGDIMTYEFNESHFFDVLGVSQIKNFTYSCEDKRYDNQALMANITINLFYYDIDMQEKETVLKLPMEIAANNPDVDSLVLEDVSLFVIENQGIKFEFKMQFTCQEDEEDITLDQNEIKEKIKEEYQETLEETMKTRESNIITSSESVFTINDLKTSYNRYRILFVDDDAKIDSYSNQYAVSIDELYKAKKHNKRLIVDASRIE